MTSWLRSAPVYLSAAALVALAWGALAPGTARASCGDYVTVGHQAPMPHDPPPPIVAAPVSFVALPCPCRPAVPVGELPPCPGCSAPTDSESATNPAPVANPDDWAVAGLASWLVAPPTTALSTVSDTVPAAHESLAIYRPPRVA